MTPTRTGLNAASPPRALQDPSHHSALWLPQGLQDPDFCGKRPVFISLVTYVESTADRHSYLAWSRTSHTQSFSHGFGLALFHQNILFAGVAFGGAWRCSWLALLGDSICE